MTAKDKNHPTAQELHTLSDDRLYTTKEVALMTDLSVADIRWRFIRRLLPASKVGGRWLILGSDLKEYMQRVIREKLDANVRHAGEEVSNAE